MNEETMRKHYERTPKEILIDILVSARKEFDKLQNKNKECKQEIERLNNSLEEQRHFYLNQLQQKENIIDKALYWLSENTHYTSLDAKELVLDNGINLKELLEILDKESVE